MTRAIRLYLDLHKRLAIASLWIIAGMVIEGVIVGLTLAGRRVL